MIAQAQKCCCFRAVAIDSDNIFPFTAGWLWFYNVPPVPAAAVWLGVYSVFSRYSVFWTRTGLYRLQTSSSLAPAASSRYSHCCTQHTPASTLPHLLEQVQTSPDISMHARLHNVTMWHSKTRAFIVIVILRDIMTFWKCHMWHVTIEWWQWWQWPDSSRVPM